MKSELKSLLSALVIFVCVFMFSGCGVKESRTVVQFASWGSKSEVDIIKPLLNDFEKQNPDIKVDFMHIPQNYFQKILIDQCVTVYSFEYVVAFPIIFLYTILSREQEACICGSNNK